MTAEEFHSLLPGDVVQADGTTGRLAGVAGEWRGGELLVRWGVGRESYTHAVASQDAARLRLIRRAAS